jgi:hypothetical protein
LEITEIAQKIVDFYQALDMFIKIILLAKHNLFFFHQIEKRAAFLLFGNGINQLDLIELLIVLINEN